MAFGSGWEVPESERGDLEYRWFRISGNRSLVLVMLSREPIWYRGHYDKGRMNPCLGDGCKLCSAKIGAQLRYVVAAAERSLHRVGLWEMGATVARDLRDLAIRRGELRGSVVEISKHSLSKHSRMEIRLVDQTEGPWWMEIDIPDIRRALYLTWQGQGYDIPDWDPDKLPPEVETKRFQPPVFRKLHL